MKLIFVYNADSGMINTLLDIGHKIVNPETYTCNLCKLTYDTFKENAKWKKFREDSVYEMEFFHRDEFEGRYKVKFEYPVVLREDNGNLEEAISKSLLESFKSLDELIDSISKF
ncbi:hypothetical protein PM10SUCC1_00120 [Propionigenium maris DSM 9537]|uniref:GTPase n=1 Tax=Propionigenium maris DSM 9537 TaxID=1123000 RepID=A0A9W6LLB2_9FUSO|nr:hypothetical protein [Propionigenium maris]GLI54497.1 hypothetical protein PM10SUCC1_00120 [Propionigenium maris DSM 9537]